MITDARELADGHLLDTEVCIVGAGVAGITLARALSTDTVNVLVIEAGGRRPDKLAQSMFWGRNVGHSYYGLDTARCCGVGGSSHKWLIQLPDKTLGARLHPLEPIDFEPRSWVPNSGWPFSYEQLVPYYEAAQQYCMAGPFSYDPSPWSQADRTPTLPLPGRNAESTVFQFASRDAFIHHPLDAIKASPTINLLTHATALDLDTNDAGTQVQGLRLATGTGRMLKVSAKRFVLAAGALESARLLLLSDRVHQRGLGNQHDLVGRYFMEHPHVWTGRYMASSQMNVDQLRFYSHHQAGKMSILGKLKTTDAAQRKYELLNHCISLHLNVKRHRTNVAPQWPINSWPLFVSDAYRQGHRAEGTGIVAADGDCQSPTSMVTGELVKRIRALRAGGGKIARHLLGGLADRLRPTPMDFKINHMSEQVPNPDSRVYLGSEKDRFGRRRIELDWRLTELDLRSIIRSQQLIDEELRQAGLGHLKIDADVRRLDNNIQGGWHHMGTTRMHADPRKGVVDSDCRVHGVDNLFIAGPSVFPTSGYANPLLTIVALSVRLADYLKQ